MFTSVLGSQITLKSFLICTVISLILGLLISLLSRLKTKQTQSFQLTLAILPAVVTIVIMLVNGNIGAGVAVAGAFGLVRFRSVPGTAQEICMIFLAVSVGLATGMGYVVLSLFFFGIISLFYIILALSHFAQSNPCERILKITIPEDMDYDGLLDDLFKEFTSSHTLESVKTSNMGTLYNLKYRIVLRNSTVPKVFLDEIRSRNGNLNISCSREITQETL